MRGRRQTLGLERDADPGPAVADADRRSIGIARDALPDVGVRVGVVSRGRKEPGLDDATRSDRLEPSRPLREPDVAEPASEQASLAAAARRLDAERPESRVDPRDAEALAVVGAADLPSPRGQRRRPEGSQLAPPAGLEVAIRGDEAELDPSARTTRGGDGRVGVGDELGDDLHEVEPSLGEVLAEVAAAHAAATDGGGIDHLWSVREEADVAAVATVLAGMALVRPRMRYGRKGRTDALAISCVADGATGRITYFARFDRTRRRDLSLTAQCRMASRAACGLYRRGRSVAVGASARQDAQNEDDPARGVELAAHAPVPHA